MKTKEELNLIGSEILDAAINVHRALGPGLLESAYHLALKRELDIKGLEAKSKVPIELIYKEELLGKAYQIDLLVEDEIVIEIKAVESMLPIFNAQMITYLKLSGKHLGYLINFNVPLLKDGFKRIVYRF